MSAAAAELASGKGHRDENFPVASFLLKAEVRAPVLTFYRFARAADDVADNETAAPAEKLRLLGEMRNTLEGRGAEPHAVALREALEGTHVPLTHALDLLTAFERDVTKLRYENWGELIDYCRVSAMPVGRFMLDVHGESRDLWPASDALCAALQVLNHIQDCGKDRRALDRVYLPLDILAAHGARVEDLDAPRASPPLRAALLDLVHRTRALLNQSRGFSRAIRDRRLGAEVAVIDALAHDLLDRLERRDPLFERVHHTKAEAALIAARAALPRLVRR